MGTRKGTSGAGVRDGRTAATRVGLWYAPRHVPARLPACGKGPRLRPEPSLEGGPTPNSNLSLHTAEA